MVPFWVIAWEVYSGTYVASHIAGHDTPELHQVNRILYPPRDPSLNAKCFGEKGQGFWVFLIKNCT